MALALQPRLSQRQVATPAMMLEFSLLQLPLGELRETVKKEVDANPALEIARDFNPGRGARGASEGFDFERVAAEGGESLEDHLMGELRMDGVEGHDLDDDGRFKGSYPDLVMATGATEAELEAARQRILAIDPKGCGARDLAECYRAQLDRIPVAKRPAVEKALDELSRAIADGRLQSFRPSEFSSFRLLQALEPFRSIRGTSPSCASRRSTSSSRRTARRIRRRGRLPPRRCGARASSARRLSGGRRRWRRLPSWPSAGSSRTCPKARRD